MIEILAVVAQNAALTFSLTGLLALLAGILILVWPRLLNYIVAIYLIAIGVIALFDISI